MSRRKTHRGQAVNGMLLLDKPSGCTSNAVLQQVKALLNARKGGHTGSLDPIATGLLPLCFGETTKLSSFFLDADKTYWARIRLGISTDTGDREGAVLERRNANVSQSEVEGALDQFRGHFQQRPPMYSAIKKNGQPLYKLAREGVEVEREPRPVTVYRLEIRSFADDELEIELACSRGFYVRGLAHDLGEVLGCGAHVSELRRLGVAGLSVENALTVEQIEQLSDVEDRRKLLIPGDRGLSHIPEVNLSVDAAFYLCRGQPVRARDLPRAGWVRLYSRDAGFLGVGTVQDDGRVAPKRLIYVG